MQNKKSVVFTDPFKPEVQIVKGAIWGVERLAGVTFTISIIGVAVYYSFSHCKQAVFLMYNNALIINLNNLKFFQIFFRNFHITIFRSSFALCDTIWFTSFCWRIIHLNKLFIFVFFEWKLFSFHLSYTNKITASILASWSYYRIKRESATSGGVCWNHVFSKI